ncbi:serine/threonine-protein kinase [Cryptosporangium aurantiacum]|uniref:non-specific serine/threonine protein kinase n=1 Tax=Cryptosporangium aurantiacum TaxID=134849 RepID=A0A1M7P838_9ACTN|nr:serine/threonine-protein kinase [Cryptosporangium aurantiacum]SHN12792.1 Serine/threonine protein kinase [Cryptosporangium aurantiacum]
MDSAGRLIGGRYRLIAEIGRGGMGVVWRALDERLGREVALKALAIPPLSTDAERAAMVSRAMQEARMAGALDHPNIVAVYDVVEEAGQPCLVMRLVRGHSLDRVVAAAGPLPPDIAARLGLTVLDALAAAHRAGVVHRDVKPANVLIQPDGTVLLSDFSIASALGGGTRTAAGVLLGTPGYIAPERLTQGTAGPPADLFALGATLYFAVEGTEAFVIGDALSGLFAVATAPHRPPERAGALAPIIDGLLAKDPRQRPEAHATAEALQAVAAPDGRALAALLAATPALVISPDPPRPPIRPTTVEPLPPFNGAGRPGLGERILARPWAALAAAGVVLVLVLGLLAYVIASSGGNGSDLTTTNTTRTPTPSASPTRSASPSASAPAGLSPDEVTLWNALPGRGIDKQTCRSGPDPDGSDVDATLVCDTVGALQTQVRFYRFDSQQDYSTHFEELDDQDGEDPSCDSPGNEGYGNWGQRGTVACYWTGVGWWINWGDRSALLGAEVQDSDADAVATWWRTNNALAG